ESFHYVLLEAQYANPNSKVFGNMMIDNLRVTSEPIGFSESNKLICAGTSASLNIPEGIDQISWWNGEVQANVTVNSAGAFWASLKKGQCTILDTIHVSVIPD